MKPRRRAQLEQTLLHCAIGLGSFVLAFGFARLIGWEVGAQLAWIGLIFFAIVGVIEGTRWAIRRWRKQRRQRTGRPASKG